MKTPMRQTSYSYRCECGYLRLVTVAADAFPPARVDCVACGEPMRVDWTAHPGSRLDVRNVTGRLRLQE